MTINIGTKVLIIDGKNKGKSGKVTHIYNGWNFIQYWVSDNKSEYMVYHNQIQELKSN